MSNGTQASMVNIYQHRARFYSVEKKLQNQRLEITARLTAHIHNTYGHDEAISRLVPLKSPRSFKKCPTFTIGYVKEDTQIYIMEGMSKLPAGEIGEIVIA